jgi:energy-coupling factor transporter ATP-binding protein EcfA2
MRSGIHLPVVERLRVINYPLYPGSTKQGLDLEFDKGVTVIAGINGIGKTTLLNLLLRMIVGPTSPSKAATRDMGRVSERRLITARKFPYFQDRAAVTLAPNATASLTFRIGNKQVVVTRRLTTLEIIKLIISGKTVTTPDNKGFLDQMAELAGMASAYDFHMVVRYVQFFTEERLPLLWSSTAQLELFKMLFVDEAIGVKLNRLYSEIQAADTDYRNRTYQYNARKARYDAAQAALHQGDTQLADIQSRLDNARKSLETAEGEYRIANERVRDLAQAHVSIDRTIEALQIELDQKVQAFNHHDAAYIAQALPTLDDKLQLLLQGLGANLGCFVCGKGGKQQTEVLRKRVRDHRCFVCDSSLAHPGSAKITPISARALQQLESEMDALRAKITAQASTLQQLDTDHFNAITQLRPIVAHRHELLMQVEQLAAQVPDTSTSAIGPLFAELEVERLALDQLAEKRTSLSANFKRHIDRLYQEMNAIESDLGARLRRYAEAFLHEKVQVRFLRNSPFKVATGAPQINLPVFRISMTSSTHLAAQERSTATSVSESQKEFLDLAFRMTLLDMIAQDGATMLVMETPEASLDSWFMARAATMMREFSPPDGKRMLIATSNINGTSMIPALLGLFKRDGTPRQLPKAQRNHLIDLMSLAEEPGVLKHDPAREALTRELRTYLGS